MTSWFWGGEVCQFPLTQHPMLPPGVFPNPHEQLLRSAARYGVCARGGPSRNLVCNNPGLFFIFFALLSLKRELKSQCYLPHHAYLLGSTKEKKTITNLVQSGH